MAGTIGFRKPNRRKFRRRKSAGYALGNATILKLAGLTFVAVLVWPDGGSTMATPFASLTTNPFNSEKAQFGYCHEGGGYNCVVDGDTFYFAGQKIRIADIDTPETHPPRCPEEARLGRAATERLYELLNAGSFTLQPIDRDTDVFGRKLRIVTRDGQSLGGVLVAEGLARHYLGGRQPWC